VRDIAIINVSGEIPAIERRSANSLSVGETVFAVGAPQGLELSITNGIVSQLRVTETGQAPMIQNTAPISPGSSGGGLFDAQGRLIGLTTYMLRESQGLNFALPSEWIASAGQRRNVNKPASSPAPFAPTRPPATANVKYTKISNAGSPLPASAALGEGAGDWACTRDNQTELIWEVKTTTGLRSNDQTYSWFQRDAPDGNPGKEDGGKCYFSGRCDTEKFVADVNKIGLCGGRNWRMPNINELKDVVNATLNNPELDNAYFPNNPSWLVWSGSPYADDSKAAWGVNFYTGDAVYYGKEASASKARLVRGRR
jgi:hypothetical protein